MNCINPKKLLNSKWTAEKPKKKEKHFIVTKVLFDEDDGVVECVLEAVMSKHCYEIDWRDLRDDEVWHHGWT
ncbi:TIGR02450 family Trp-rich protein [Vibrio sp. ZSDZ34]|jgi:tryptophan-rich hypothetical protein|uniref:TIGR02450 family Trp-rich protein n=1 Tax=Vibrio gelatinilyticus TaxID=2893468 RepID=A0A9X2AWQ7_9VIBR|nr:TIGR02450 family Trp-rich protein [Vibrio gelatinilyticus]MCJ2377561.1 TIGR02450 family Trp-rich protein [Vibrio gelatinilyticus]